MKKLGVGIIGMGMAFERLHYPAYKKMQDKYEIKAICDIKKNKADNWRETLSLRPEDIYSDYREMIERDDIDVFDIMVPIELNFEVTEIVAKKRKPIICEKPLAPTIEQAKKASNLPQKYNIPIMIAENYRYNQEINIIKDLIKNNEIGNIYYFIQNRVINFPKDMLKNKFPAVEWRQYPKYPGGSLLDTAVHDIAAIHHIFGMEEKIQAFGYNQRESYSPYAVIQTNMKFKNNITGHFSFFAAGKEMQRPLIGLRIFGNQGMIYLEERDCGTINISYNSGNSRQLAYQPQMGFYNELLNFYKAAIGKEPLSVTPEMEYGDTATIFSILKSINENKVVTTEKLAKTIY